MKPLLLQYATYNAWAHTRIYNAVQLVPAHVQVTKAVGSFETIQATLYHLWFAENTWAGRIGFNTANAAAVEPGTETATICYHLLQISHSYIQYIEKANESTLAQQVTYRTTKNELFQQPVYQILHHVFNHATYHRGQIISMLRSFKIGNLPATDFIVWSRTAGL